VAQARRRGKAATPGKRKGARGKKPWATVITVIIFIAVAAAYLTLRYGAVGRYPEERVRDLYRKPRSGTLRLYFSDAQGERLIAERRSAPTPASLEERIEVAVRELLRGPRGSLTRTIPTEVELQGVRVEGDRVVWLNFSPSFASAHPGGSTAELMTIYSIVNTVLLNFREVQKVGILVDGKRIDTLAGHIDCRSPFTADKTLIR